MEIDEAWFEEVKKRVLGSERGKKGIGTLSEKTVHAVLKQYYQPDPALQEVGVEGMIADIFTGEEILEIQTRNFYSLKKKLDKFLLRYPVTIIYPLPRQKWIVWIDPTTGERGKKRKSPKKGTVYDACKELSKITEFLTNKRLSVKIVFLDMEEYRLLNGWDREKKRGSHRYDRIPIQMVEEIELLEGIDYQKLIPAGLAAVFDAKDFAKAAKIRPDRARQALYILYHLGQVERIGKQGNAYLYRLCSV